MKFIFCYWSILEMLPWLGASQGSFDYVAFIFFIAHFTA
jgi:hypothetical protein